MKIELSFVKSRHPQENFSTEQSLNNQSRLNKIQIKSPSKHSWLSSSKDTRIWKTNGIAEIRLELSRLLSSRLNFWLIMRSLDLLLSNGFTLWIFLRDSEVLSSWEWKSCPSLISLMRNFKICLSPRLLEQISQRVPRRSAETGSRRLEVSESWSPEFILNAHFFQSTTSLIRAR